MYPGNDRIDRDDELLSRRAVEERRIVTQVEAARTGERREEASDPAELAEALAHDRITGRLQFGGAQGAGEAVEHPVRQPGLLAGEEGMGDADIFAHGHARRDVGGWRKLVSPRLEEQPQDRVEPPERPFFAERRRDRL